MKNCIFYNVIKRFYIWENAEKNYTNEIGSNIWKLSGKILTDTKVFLKIRLYHDAVCSFQCLIKYAHNMYNYIILKLLSSAKKNWNSIWNTFPRFCFRYFIKFHPKYYEIKFILYIYPTLGVTYINKIKNITLVFF